MTSRPRGRPSSPQRKLLKNPPEHIAKRIAARAGVQSDHWQPLRRSMDEYHLYLQAYRRSLFNVKTDVAAGLLSIYCDAMTRKGFKQLSKELAKAKAKVAAGRSQQAKQRKCNQPEWKGHVAHAMKLEKFAHISSALRVAQLILKALSESRIKVPALGTARKFIGAQRKLAKLPLRKNSSE